jgi:hypothetical protein
LCRLKPLQKPQVVLNKSDVAKLPLVLKKPMAGLPSPSHRVNIPGKLQTILPHLCQNISIPIEEVLPSQKISPLIASGECYGLSYHVLFLAANSAGLD